MISAPTIRRWYAALLPPLAAGWCAVVLTQAARFLGHDVGAGATLGVAALVATAVAALRLLGQRLADAGYPNVLAWCAGTSVLLAGVSVFWRYRRFLVRWLAGTASLSSPYATDWLAYADLYLPLALRGLALLAAVTFLMRLVARRNWGTAGLTALGVATVALLLLRGDRMESIEAAAFFLWVFLAGHAGVLLSRVFLRGEVPWHIGTLALYALLGLLLLGVGHLGCFHPPVLLALVSIVAVLGLVRVLRDRNILLARLHAWSARLGPVEVTYLAGLWLCAAVAFINATGPEIGYDAVHYYISYMARLLREGAMRPEPLHWAHMMPQWSQTFFALGYGTAGEVGAKWLAWSASVCLGLALHDELRRVGVAPRAALAATLLFSGSPFVVLWSSTCYYDLTLTAMVLAGVHCLRRAIVEPRLSWSAGTLAALFLGTALCLKYTTLMFGAVLGPVALLAFAAPWRRTLAVLVGVGLGALVVAAPWYATTYHWTGNPVFPFFNQYFHSPYWPVNYDIRRVYDGTFGYPNRADYLVLPWKITFETSRVAEEPDGSLGLALLLFIPLLAWVRGRLALGYLALAAGFVALTGLTTVYVRYWLPVLPFLAIAMARAWSSAGPSLAPLNSNAARWAAAGLLVLFAVLQLPLGLRGNYGAPRGFAWAYYCGQEGRDRYLSRANLPAAAFREIAEEMAPGESVFCADYHGLGVIPTPCYGLIYWQQRLMVQDHWSWYEAQFREKNAHFVAIPSSPAFVERFYRDRGWAPYLSPGRLCCTSGTVRLYDLKTERWPVEALLARCPVGVSPSVSAGQALDSAAEAPPLVITGTRPFKQELEVPETARQARVVLETQSKEPSLLVLRVFWLDTAGQVLEEEQAELDLEADKVRELLYAGRVPDGANRVRLVVSSEGEVTLHRGTIDFAR